MIETTSAAFVPVVWNFVAVYLLAGTLWAGIPLVAFATLMLVIAAGALLRYDQMVRSPAGRYLAVVFLVWALVQASAVGPASAFRARCFSRRARLICLRVSLSIVRMLVR